MKARLYLAKTLALLTLGVMPTLASAQNLASPEETAAAIGHYARARSMLMEALKEFERGRSLAQPDMILSGEEWRNTVVARANDLGRLISPEPRISRTGVRFEPSPSLLREEHEREPVMSEAPRRISSIKRASSSAATRAKLKSEAAADQAAEQEKKTKAARNALDQLMAEEEKAAVSEPAKQPVAKAAKVEETPKKTDSDSAAAKAASSETPAAVAEQTVEDDEISKAIEERLKSLEATEAK